MQKFGHSESVLQNLLLCEIVYVVTNIVSDFLISFHWYSMYLYNHKSYTQILDYTASADTFWNL